MPGYTNVKQVLEAATKFPAAIEAKLPAGAPKLSTTLLDVAGMIPAVPDFPIAVPEMPAVPEIPDLPGGIPSPFVTEASVTPVNAGVNQAIARAQQDAARPQQINRGSTIERTIPSPYVGVMPEVITRRGM